MGTYKSTDNGNLWKLINSYFNTLCIYTKLPYIFVGTERDGVIFSTDSGNSWTPVNSGLSDKEIHSITMTDEYIYAGSYNAGVFRAKLSDFIITDVQENIPSNNEISIYPNPASSQITTNFPNETKYNSITLYNSLGMEVEKIENSDLLGKNNINISTEDLPIGMYYLTFDNQGNRVTKSFVVVR